MTHDNFDELFGDAARSYNEPPSAPREEMWDAISRARSDAQVIPISSARPSRSPQRWVISAAGIAAVLVVGIAIGRASRDSGAPTQVATNAVPESSATRTQMTDTVVPTAPGDERSASQPSSDAGQPARSGNAASPREQRLAARPDFHRDLRRPLDVSGDDGAYRLAVVEHLTRTEVLLTGFRADARTGADHKLDAQLATLSKDLLATTRLLISRRGADPTLSRLLQDLELVLMQLSQYATDGKRVDFDAVNQSIEKRNVLPKLRSTIPAGTSMSAGT